MNSPDQVVIDWDGTAVPNVWPERAHEFMPGFVENMKRLHRAGVPLIIFSARYTPFDYVTLSPLPPHIPAGEVAYIRDMLDRAGLTFIDIWTKPGKPSGSVYVDDKGERYTGKARSWDRLTDKILIRLGKEIRV